MSVEINKNFGTRNCPSCATDVPANSNRCPICGYEFPVMPRGRKTVFWIAGVILLIILVGSWVLRIW